VIFRPFGALEVGVFVGGLGAGGLGATARDITVGARSLGRNRVVGNALVAIDEVITFLANGGGFLGLVGDANVLAVVEFESLRAHPLGLVYLVLTSDGIAGFYATVLGEIKVFGAVRRGRDNIDS